MDAHIVTPKMGRKEKFVLNKGIDSGQSERDSSSRKSNIAVPVDDLSLDEEDVNHWTSERIMRGIIIFLSVLVLLLTVIIIILVAQKSSESNGGVVSASQGEVPSVTTKPPVVKEQLHEDVDYDDRSRKGKIPPGFHPSISLDTEETVTARSNSTTTGSSILDASGDLPIISSDASGDASGSGDSPVPDGRTINPRIPLAEDLLPVSNSQTTLDTWNRFLKFQNSGSTTRQAPPVAQAAETHDYHADYEAGANGASEGRICHSAACRRLSLLMGGIMNEETSPCQDFYRLACGGVGMGRSFVRLTPIGPQEDVDRRLSAALSGSGDQSSRKLMSLLHDQCGLLATALNEQERLEVVRSAVWQRSRFLTPADDIPPDMTSLLTQLLLSHSTSVFDVLLDIGRPDASRFVFKITPPHHPPLLGRADKEHCSHRLREAVDYPPEEMLEALNEYNRCMRDHWMAMDRLKESINALRLGWDQKQLEELFTFIDMDYFMVLNSYLPEEGSLRKMLITKDYTDMSVDQLGTLCPAVEWRRLLSDLTGRPIDQVERVHVYAPSYLKGVCRDFLASSDVRQVYNTLLALYADDLYWNFVPNESVQRRHCQSVTVHLMEDVASAAYLSTFTGAELDSMKSRLTNVFDQLKSTLVRQVKAIDSVEQTLKTQLLNKAEGIRIDLENGMFLVRNPQSLDDRWKDFQLGSNFITSAIALLRRYRQKMYELHDMNPDDPEAVWSFCALPTFTTGYVLYSLNKLVIPFGTIAGGQLENVDYPQFWNVGRIGYLMSHELMHAFDRSGIHHQMATHLNSTDVYRRGLQCLSDELQSDEFSARSLVDVDRVWNELYADATGLTLAFQTYRQMAPVERGAMLPAMNWTDEQLFFLSTAQIYCSDSPMSLFELATKEHLPGPLRVNHLMKLNPDFARVFHCSFNKTCQIFPFH